MDRSQISRLIAQGAAGEIVSEIERLRAELSASQAREAKLLDGYARLRNASDSEMCDGDLARDIAAEVLAMPTDDTALRERLAAERARCVNACDARRDCGPDNGCCQTYWNEALEEAMEAIKALSVRDLGDPQ